MSRRKTDTVRLYHVAGYRVLLQQTGLPIVNVECAINAGFVKETKETSGVNHILEHILTEAWKKCGSTCSGFWGDKGVDMNASTDETVLRYHTRGTAVYLDQMIAYITNISTHPIFSLKTLKKEKEAVIDELLTYGNDPESRLDEMFNENFYTGGLVYKDDWQLQIKNLKHLDLAKIRKTYEENYNPGNIIFIVTGKFQPHHVLQIFHRELQKRPIGTVFSTTASCFSLRHKICFCKEDSTTTKIVLGWPSKLTAHDAEAVYLNMLVGILNDILFAKLRTELSLVYGAHFTYVLNMCGTSLMCSIYVRDKNVVECLRAFFRTMNGFLRNVFPKQKIFAAVQRETYNYSKDLPYTKDYLLQYVHQMDTNTPLVHSKKDKIGIISKVTPQIMQKLFKELYSVDKCLIVYQGKTDLSLTWEKLL
jgi:predicted Zn-dependent peptidase